MENDLIFQGERLDDLQRNGLKLIQNPDKFCFGMDAVLLSAFAKVKAGNRVLDLCTGNGVIPILLAGRTEGQHFTGLEIQDDVANMARRSVCYNKLEEKVHIQVGDVKEASSFWEASSFDVITCNPPYMIGTHGLKNEDPAKMIARHEILCTLEDVIDQATRLLKPGGHFYMVHRPFRLAEIIETMVRHRLEPKGMRLVYPSIDKEPNMLLVEGVRGGKSRIHVEKPLIVYEKPGVYTEEVREMYDW